MRGSYSRKGETAEVGMGATWVVWITEKSSNDQRVEFVKQVDRDLRNGNCEGPASAPSVATLWAASEMRAAQHTDKDKSETG